MVKSAGTLTAVQSLSIWKLPSSFFRIFPGIFPLCSMDEPLSTFLPFLACISNAKSLPTKKADRSLLFPNFPDELYDCLKNRSSTLSCVLVKTYCKQSGPKPVLIDSGCVRGIAHLQHLPSCNRETFLSRRI